MAQSGYTPISLYFSTTASAVPLAANLAQGELAINIADGKLYYENSSGVVTLLASATTVTNSFSAGTTGLTPNTATTGAVTLAGTLAVANGGTGLTAGTSGGVLAYTATGTLASSTALASNALVIGGGAGAAPSTTTTGTGVVTALGVNVGTAGAFVVNGGALGTPSSGTVTNLTGTASININGTVGATTANTGAFTTGTFTPSGITQPVTIGQHTGAPSYGVVSLNGSMTTTGVTGLAGGGGGDNNLYLKAPTGYSVLGNINNSTVTTTSSTGLAVTGTLSATGNATIGNAVASTDVYLNIAGVASRAGGIAFKESGVDKWLIGNGAASNNGKFELYNTTGVVVLSVDKTSSVSTFGAGVAVTGTLSSTLGATIQGLTVGLGAGAVASNTAVGASALAANTTGTNNTAVGYQALTGNTTADSNSAFGYFALRGNTTGTVNAAFALGALQQNTTGSSNTAFGTQALQSNTTASYNTAVGYQAGYSNSTGAYGVYLGYQAGYATNATYGNVCIGYKVGHALTGGGNTLVGALSTAGGDGAGTVLTTGTQNSFFGTSAGNLVTTGSKNVIVGSYNGNQGNLDIRTASNYIVLSDGDGNPRGIFDGSGNLLVGATSVFSNAKVTVSSTATDGIASTQGTAGGYCFVANALSNGGTYYLEAFTANGTGVGSITSNGTITVYGTTSDQRLKENIQDAAPASALIDSLQVRQYDWKSDGSHQRYGFVAQELVTVAPEAVHQPTNPEEMMAVDYSKLVPMLVKEIQSLRARVAQLESKP